MKTLYTNIGYAIKSHDDPLPSVVKFDEKTLGWELKPNETIKYGVPCLAYLKKPSSKIMYIPVEWLDNVGYSEGDLKRWLSIISLPGIFNLPFRYYGIVKDSIIFPMSKVITKRTEYPLIRIIDPSVATNIVQKENKWYVVGINGINKSFIKNYLAVILLRFIYNHLYNDIPRTVFEIKDSIKGINNWSAIIMAHYRRMYYSYYGVVGSLQDNPNLGQFRLNPFKKLDITAMEKTYQNNIISFIGLFKQHCGDNRLEHLNFPEIETLFLNKKYKEVYDKLKKAVQD